MNLRRTTDLHETLVAVADRQFVCHPAWSPHVPGWGWTSGGDIGLSLQGYLSTLHRARLIDIDRRSFDHVGGDPVVLTRAGVARLREWESVARQLVNSTPRTETS